ncbi:GGDEF domain-containing protein [Butyrivibrio sp. AE2005]|uniref:GGDEF domain-containing protein n=1 Tax=Butyrivibrio sp. AE2005 TaxID=1496722 RepID=UPI00047BF336|nr:GGDEF domain-containing protein [Butyrivibrio sp. AE2005]
MYWQKINYYGFEKHRYDDCKKLIHDTNYTHLLIINSWLLLMTLTFMILCLLNEFGLTRRNFNMYYSFMILSLVFEVVFIVLKKFCARYSTFFVHASSIILIVFGIFSSVSQPYLAATMYLVIVVLLSVTYIDTMIRFTVLLIFYCSVFLYTSFKFKPHSLAELDMYNIIVFLALSLILHYFFQHNKMTQFYTLQKNIQIQRDLEIRSSFDTLTDLLNRARFFAIADQIIKDPIRRDEFLAVCLLDLDKFKEINDKLGHQMGDKAIQTTSHTIVEALNIDMFEKWSFTERAVRDKFSIAGRLGGDEYIMLIRGQKNMENVISLLQYILTNLNAVQIGELSGINASLGVTAVTGNDKDMDAIYKRADEALYQSKKQGRNRITVG